jgi:hypothetical protein
MKILRNEKGAMVIAGAILAMLITLILIVATQSRMQSTVQAKSRYKALLDAQLAIDQFAIQLKHGYELATPSPESNGASPIYPLASTATWNIPTLPVGSTEPIQFYLPSTSFPNAVNEICVHRSDGRDDALLPVVIVGVPRICIKIPDNLSASLDQNTIRFFPKRPAFSNSPDSKFFAFFQLLSRIAPQDANADLSDAYGPNLTGSLPSVPLTNITGDADLAFQIRYANNNYAPKTDRFFLNINFCVKYANDCTPEELIYQTYIFLKPPKTSQDK